MRRVVPLAVLLLGLVLSRPAFAQGVFFSTEAVLKEFFASSERVGFVTVHTAEVVAELSRLLGYVPNKSSYTVFVAKTGEHVDGYAVIDEQLGQHLPITLATKLSPEGVVQRVEVMVYRESYGHEVREPRFRQQFTGKSVADPMRLGDDVVAISGATISSRSMAIAVRRAAALVSVMPKPKERAKGAGGAGAAVHATVGD